MIGRLSKMLMCLALAAFAGIAAFDNVADYAINFESVQHVLSMHTTFPHNALMSRAITRPSLWHLGYALIIGGEAVTAALFLAAALALWRTRQAATGDFQAAKRWAQAAAAAGFLVWFVGFEIVGGEWFAMWESPHWNGQEAAFRFYMTMLVVLIFVNQPDAGPPAALLTTSGSGAAQGCLNPVDPR